MFEPLKLKNRTESQVSIGFFSIQFQSEAQCFNIQKKSTFTPSKAELWRARHRKTPRWRSIQRSRPASTQRIPRRNIYHTPMMHTPIVRQRYWDGLEMDGWGVFPAGFVFVDVFVVLVTPHKFLAVGFAPFLWGAGDGWGVAGSDCSLPF